MTAKLTCQVIGGLTLVYAYLNFVLYLSTFASPNFRVLIDYSLIPGHSDTFSRVWFVLLNLALWSVTALVSALLLVGITWNHTPIFRPYLVWTVICVVQEGITAVGHVVTYSDSHQLITIFQKLTLSVFLQLFSLYKVIQYGQDVDDIIPNRIHVKEGCTT